MRLWRTSRRRRAHRTHWTPGMVLTLEVMAIQALMVLLYLTEAARVPPRGGLIEAMWVSNRPWLVLSLAAVIVLALPLSLFALALRGRHKWLLAGAWIAFGMLLYADCLDKIETVGRVVWVHKVQSALGR